MSRLTDLLARVKARDPELGYELEKEYKTLSSRRAFGLNFERHSPENVELPGRPVRKGDKVRILPDRGSTKKGDQRLWRVNQIVNTKPGKKANLSLIDGDETCYVSVEDLVVVAEFKDYIYPGLKSTGKVENGGDKPFHTVINGENYHALEALTFTHPGKIDAIYIDPPYNSGARDWKYNNDYVEKEDNYRHSKWLAFMERRLKLAKKLINRQDGVLIATIDEKEVHRLALLLSQMFPESNIQLITSVISQNGTSREGEFSRVEEFLVICRFGLAKIERTNDNMLSPEGKGKVSRIWFNFMRTSTPREKLEGQYYPIFINPKDGLILKLGEPVGKGNTQPEYPDSDEKIALWPLREDGGMATWGAVPSTAQKLLSGGFLRLGKLNKKTGKYSIQYVRQGDRNRLSSGQIQIVGKNSDGSLILSHKDVSKRKNFPKTVWNRKSHDATAHGTRLNKVLMPGRNFPYPKSLYAVEDVLRFFIKEKKTAYVLDFFAGSGTSAHAVMRLNRQDGGRRQCISITNNEVSADEQADLRKKGLRPGDDDWERWGINEYLTIPRLTAAISGISTDGTPIQGDYKFKDEFPISDGFTENAEFFTLTYETPVAISHNKAFSRIAPLLWMRAGSKGRRIDAPPKSGWEVADTYGLLTDLDKASEYCDAISNTTFARIAYIVTDDERRFQSIVRDLPDHIEPVRLYESYLSNFRFSVGR